MNLKFNSLVLKETKQRLPKSQLHALVKIIFTTARIRLTCYSTNYLERSKNIISNNLRNSFVHQSSFKTGLLPKQNYFKSKTCFAWVTLS